MSRILKKTYCNKRSNICIIVAWKWGDKLMYLKKHLKNNSLKFPTFLGDKPTDSRAEQTANKINSSKSMERNTLVKFLISERKSTWTQPERNHAIPGEETNQMIVTFSRRNHGDQRKWHNIFQRAERIDLSTQKFCIQLQFSLYK